MVEAFLVLVGVSSVTVLRHFIVLDRLSLVLIVLTFVVCRFRLLASSKVFFERDYSRYFTCLMVIAVMRLVLAFRSRTLIRLYWWFEGSLIPLAFIIVG